MTQEQIRLIEKYLDHQANESELNRILELVETDEEFRAELEEALYFKGVFKVSQDSSTQTLEEEVIQNLNHSTTHLESHVMSKIQSKNIYRFPLWLKVVAAQMVLLPILVYIIFSQQTTKVVNIEIAKIIESKGFSFIVRGDSKINLKKGDQLLTRDHLHIQPDSHLKIEYHDGTKLKFLENSFVRFSDIKGQKKVELFSGQVEADVAKQPLNKEMIILTEHSKAKILGTKFILSSSDVSSLLEVSEGKVSMEHQDESVVVPARHYISAGGETDFVLKENNDPLYVSPLITEKTPGYQVPMKVDIKGSRKLYLVISNGGENNRFDHGAWINPKLKGPKGELDLVELPWLIAKSGSFRISKNKGHYGQNLMVNDKVIQKGIAAHATSIIAWDIPEGYHWFESTGAILDSGIKQKDAVPSMNFEVYSNMPEEMLNKLLIRKHHF